MAVRLRRYSSGKTGWQVDVCLADGKRIQRSFATKGEAEREEARIMGERRKYGEVALAMSHAQRLRYAEVEAKLAALGVSLEQAVEWAAERARAVRVPIALERLRDAYLATKGRRRERYVVQLGYVLSSFVRGRELVEAHTVTQDDVRRWLEGNGWGIGTQRNYLGDLRGLWRWARLQGHTATDPCEGIRLESSTLEEEREISAFGPEQIERLFSTALEYVGRVFDRGSLSYREAHVYRPLLGYLALATFPGVRPEEVKRTPRTEIDLEHRTLVITAGRAKTRRRRVVDLTPNCCDWLALWQRLCPDQEMIIPRNFRKLWEGLRETAGLKPAGWRPKARQKAEGRMQKVAPWPHDVLRHTAATMHYALHQNTALLQAQLGHSEDENTLFRRYRAVRLLDGRTVSRAIAERFWAIAPPGGSHGGAESTEGGQGER